VEHDLFRKPVSTFRDHALVVVDPRIDRDGTSGRGLVGDHARPFEAQLDLTDGKAAWIVKDAEEAVRMRVAALLAAGMSVREIAEETGATKSAVHRMKQRIERETREVDGGEEGGSGEGK
jgi:hypothetical protein